MIISGAPGRWDLPLEVTPRTSTLLTAAWVRLGTPTLRVSPPRPLRMEYQLPQEGHITPCQPCRRYLCRATTRDKWQRGSHRHAKCSVPSLELSCSETSHSIPSTLVKRRGLFPRFNDVYKTFFSPFPPFFFLPFSLFLEQTSLDCFASSSSRPLDLGRNEYFTKPYRGRQNCAYKNVGEVLPVKLVSSRSLPWHLTGWSLVSCPPSNST